MSKASKKQSAESVDPRTIRLAILEGGDRAPGSIVQVSNGFEKRNAKIIEPIEGHDGCFVVTFENRVYRARESWQFWQDSAVDAEG